MKRMKLRQVLQSGRATVAALAGTAMVVGGAGAGTAALALGHSAGALSLQAPAIAVREQNVNAAGRIRVALPNGGVGVNGTVSVNNFPKSVNVGNLPENSAGRLQTQNGTGVSHEITFGGRVSGSSPITIANVNGSGVFEGIDIGDTRASGNASCYNLTIVIDGTPVFNNGWATATITSPVNQGNSQYVSGPNQAGGYAMSFTPSGGLPFHHSLLVQTYAYNCGGNSAHVSARGWYTTNS